MSIVSKVYQFFKYIKFWRDGGVTKLSIAQISYFQILDNKRIIVTGGGEWYRIGYDQKVSFGWC